MTSQSSKLRLRWKEEEPEKYQAYLVQQRIKNKERRDRVKAKRSEEVLTRSTREQVEREKMLARERGRRYREKKRADQTPSRLTCVVQSRELTQTSVVERTKKKRCEMTEEVRRNHDCEVRKNHYARMSRQKKAAVRKKDRDQKRKKREEKMQREPSAPNGVVNLLKRLPKTLLNVGSRRPFVCQFPGCLKTFIRSQHLTRHCQRVHEKRDIIPSRLICENCGEDFANQDSLHKHVKVVHHPKKEKLYKCPAEGCGESFHKKKQLLHHRMTHEDNYSMTLKLIKCPHEGCGKSFAYPNLLRKHSKVHQGYPCDEAGCSEVFPTWSKLRKHKSDAHTSKKCATCGAVFKELSGLTRHRKIHDTEREAVVCPEEGCGRVYFYMKNLRQHIRAFHRGEGVWKKKKEEKRKSRNEKKKRQQSKRRSLAAKLMDLDDGPKVWADAAESMQGSSLSTQAEQRKETTLEEHPPKERLLEMSPHSNAGSGSRIEQQTEAPLHAALTTVPPFSFQNGISSQNLAEKESGIEKVQNEMSPKDFIDTNLSNKLQKEKDSNQTVQQDYLSVVAQCDTDLIAVPMETN